ncbi:unconventional prefoldin RPB5 interactor 1 isoform X1 [Chiloscyllium plagiosum]|uniref:unconventional prefoldin RPB5 interactor 1 isoform X1 n=1 Tax=Chiloscyllium plagiosum TaxID=36176 RepID=UPI001CB85E17|nr:unconventional prefoldin RPB5 interactor 1 isoform X1 [Chiloscyllium plagiosum]
MADSQHRPRAAGKPPHSQPLTLSRLREEHGKVVSSCKEKIQHWVKVQNDYEALQGRLKNLPDKVSYDVMVPFGPLAFMPGQLIHTNEVTVLLGDNWFAKCSAKQALSLVEHRKKHVQKALDDLHKVMKNFESRVEFTEMEKLANEGFVEIREEIQNEERETQDLNSEGKQRRAHKPKENPKPKEVFVSELEGSDGGGDCKSSFLTEEELWARLDELEQQEEMQDEIYRMSDSADGNTEESSSSEEEKDKNIKLNIGEKPDWKNGHENDDSEEASELSPTITHINGLDHKHSQDDAAEEVTRDDDEEVTRDDDNVPTIHFLHTVEPKRVRINTGKNTTLKFSEKKEEAKRKRKNSTGNGNTTPELPNIKTPADIYRLFVDVVNGEYVPRKSILKSRSRENSVCSDTSESSTTEFEDRRCTLRSLSHEEAVHSDASECSILEEENISSKPLPWPSSFEAFSGTVVEKEPISPTLMPYPTIAHPVLPTIPEKKVSEEESFLEASQELPKKVSKFKAARMQQKK